MIEPRKPKSDGEAFQEACQRAGVDDPLINGTRTFTSRRYGALRDGVIDEITHGTLIELH